MLLNFCSSLDLPAKGLSKDSEVCKGHQGRIGRHSEYVHTLAYIAQQ